MASNWLPLVALTASGRPVFLTGEVERCLLPSVDLEPGENTDLATLVSGLLVLTSHRLLWIDEQSASGFAIPLAAIIHAYPPKKSLRHMFASPRIRIQVSVSPDRKVAEGGTRSEVITVVMRGKNDPDAFYGRLLEVMRSRQWEVSVTEEKRVFESGSAEPMAAAAARVRMPVVGVSGILRKEQELWESTDKSLQEAFQDLNALMSKAKEMVQLAEKMRMKLLSGTSSQGNPNDDEMGSKQEMQDWLLSVGIASPVTKESAGALYHQQLARELADFVKVPLEKAGGMIALVDVYCLYNRARGTALISPEDLLQACTIWEKFDVYAIKPSSFQVPVLLQLEIPISDKWKPSKRIMEYSDFLSNNKILTILRKIYFVDRNVMLRKFDSGVMVIQSKAQRDDEVFARITALVQNPDALRTGISPSDAALTLGIAPALAKEQLLTAESKGLLCRDVSPDGFRFFINLFREIDPNDIYLIKNSGPVQAWFSSMPLSG